VRASKAGPLIVALGVALPVASAVAGSEPPALLAIEPSSVVAHRPPTLVLEGKGFLPEVTVLIETGLSGKFLRYRPREITDDRCVVSLSSGFPSRPSEVSVFVENPDGSRSETLSFSVEPKNSDPIGDSGQNQLEPSSSSDPGSLEASGPASDQLPPTIREIRPSGIPAGRPLILEIFGSGFEENSSVLVTANLHAGSSRLPEYALRAFPSYFIDAELIEVEFDLGFYPIPGVRDVIVENASGGRSEPAILEILQNSRKQEE
jgi:hypothetical protein